MNRYLFFPLTRPTPETHASVYLLGMANNMFDSCRRQGIHLFEVNNSLLLHSPPYSMPTIHKQSIPYYRLLFVVGKQQNVTQNRKKYRFTVFNHSKVSPR